jgi:uncharacterized membrane-anchored protein YhcB (DUF1043 family)
MFMPKNEKINRSNKNSGPSNYELQKIKDDLNSFKIGIVAKLDQQSDRILLLEKENAQLKNKISELTELIEKLPSENKEKKKNFSAKFEKNSTKRENQQVEKTTNPLFANPQTTKNPLYRPQNK